MLSCLYITYNRSELLARSLNLLKPAIEDCGFKVEYVVSDDGSSQSHISCINKLDFDLRIYANVNEGLGKNCNKGLRACNMPLILQVQDDWSLGGQPQTIADAVEILTTDSEVGIVQLNLTSSDLPSEKRCTPNGVKYQVFANDMVPWNRACGKRPYSDQPHIKRGEFVDDLGPYLEHVPMTVMENEYKKRVANQHRWHVASFLTEETCFTHMGEEESFNPGAFNKGRLWWLRKAPVFGRFIPFARSLLSKSESLVVKLFYHLRRIINRLSLHSSKRTS